MSQNMVMNPEYNGDSSKIHVITASFITLSLYYYMKAVGMAWE